jgi:hypothetical protein
MNGAAAIVVSALSIAIANIANAQSTARPNWSEGDRWEYRISLLPVNSRSGTFVYDGAVSVQKTRDDRYDITFAGYYGAPGTGVDRTVRYSLDLNRVSRAYEGGPLNETKWYQWPLQPEASWEFDYHQPDGQRVSVWSMSVKGWEKVSVPAGTFNALHIVGIRKTLTGSSGASREDIWFAPEVRRHIKYELYQASTGYTWEHKVEELTAFTVR